MFRRNLVSSKLLPSLILGTFVACMCFLLGVPFAICLVALASMAFLYCLLSVLLCLFFYNADVREVLKTGNAFFGYFVLGFFGFSFILAGAEKLSTQYMLSFPLAVFALLGFASIWLATGTWLLFSLRIWDVQGNSLSRMR